MSTKAYIQVAPKEAFGIRGKQVREDVSEITGDSFFRS